MRQPSTSNQIRFHSIFYSLPLTETASKGKSPQRGEGEGGRALLPSGGLQALEWALPEWPAAVPHARVCPSPPPHASPPGQTRLRAEGRVEETLAASDPWGVRPLLSILILSPYLLTLTITQVCVKGKKKTASVSSCQRGGLRGEQGSCAGGRLRDSGGSRVCGPERPFCPSCFRFSRAHTVHRVPECLGLRLACSLPSARHGRGSLHDIFSPRWPSTRVSTASLAGELGSPPKDWLLSFCFSVRVSGVEVSGELPAFQVWPVGLIPSDSHGIPPLLCLFF